jgi:hypothetical protein
VKSYPSIPTKIRPDLPIHAFDKLDGSQIRAEWTAKKGFTAFGSRHRTLEASHPHLGEAIQLVRDKYEADVTRALTGRKVKEALLFFEFFGPGSFAGRHVEEPHDVVLIDASPFGRGLLLPDEFLQLFGHLHTARLLYTGPITRELVNAVRAGTLPGVTSEGVICKAKELERNKSVMFKIKAQAWLDRLRDLCAGDDALYEELA